MENTVMDGPFGAVIRNVDVRQLDDAGFAAIADLL